MKRMLILVAAVIAAVTLSGCLAVTGEFRYTDPETGATVGLGVGRRPTQPLELPKKEGLVK
jgi:hypothetical protein